MHTLKLKVRKCRRHGKLNKNWSILIFLFITLSSTSVIVGSSFINVNASNAISTEDPSGIAQFQPHITGNDSQSTSNIFYSKAYELPNNSNNLVVLIPNEGHHNFRDLRGGQSGTGDEQTSIVWRAPTNMQITSVLSQLSEFSSQLLYS